MLILLVDDDRMLAGSVRRSLELRGHDVIYAETSQEALALVGPAFDVILSDLNLRQGLRSELNGDALVPLLRERYPDAKIALWSGLTPPRVPEADAHFTKDGALEALDWIEAQA
jgi:CheY-like chemotaxis protein